MAALGARFTFESMHSQPPRRTASTDAIRALVAPAWVWASPPYGPRANTSAAELRRALERLPALGLSSEVEEVPAAHETELVDVVLWGERAVDCGAQPNVREWRGAARRLGTPSRRSLTLAALLATVVGY